LYREAVAAILRARDVAVEAFILGQPLT